MDTTYTLKEVLDEKYYFCNSYGDVYTCSQIEMTDFSHYCNQLIYLKLNPINLHVHVLSINVFLCVFVAPANTNSDSDDISSKLQQLMNLGISAVSKRISDILHLPVNID